MSPEQVNEYMAARVDGAEFDDVQRGRSGRSLHEGF
jgi:hypothetical protein